MRLGIQLQARKFLHEGTAALVLILSCVVTLILLHGSMLTNGDTNGNILKALDQSLLPDKLVNIFTFQKNEGRLVLEWGAWHGGIFGFDALHIIDHESDDPQTKLYLSMLASKGAQVTSHSGSFTDKWTQLTERMAASAAKLLIPMDVDEFMVLIVNNSFVVDSSQVYSTMRYLPTDGRRYRMKTVDAMYCPTEYNTRVSSWTNFSRPQEMTVFSPVPSHISCQSKTFYSHDGFIQTDQGNHGGAVAMDAQDSQYKINGCSYFHSPSIGLAHYGAYLPWETYREKMIRGAKAYNHTNRVKAGQSCSGNGVHYCRFWEKYLKFGEQALQEEYDKSFNCTSISTFRSKAISEGVKIALDRINFT